MEEITDGLYRKDYQIHKFKYSCFQAGLLFRIIRLRLVQTLPQLSIEVIQTAILATGFQW